MTPGARLQAVLDEGVRTGAFPLAVAVVLVEGEPALAAVAGGATIDTVFDLASLTKVLATTPLFLTLWRDAVVSPEAPVERFAPGTPLAGAGATLADLLAHRAGLPGFAPLFAPVLRARPALLTPECPPEERAAARADTVARAFAVVPEAPPRARAVYSDVGFLVLGELLAAAAGAPLDAAFGQRVAVPLGSRLRFHRLSTGRCGGGADPAWARVAPTGWTRPREPAPGQEGLWEPMEPHPSAPGEVDDDNAWVMDGVAGHAGLFGTAADVAALGQAILEDWAGAARLAPAACWRLALERDAATPSSTRAFGFDTRRPGDAPVVVSAGCRLGDRPPGAVGHTGYTGTSLWIDLGRRLVAVLCTNRTAGPRGRAELGLNALRPRFHDTVVEALGLD